MRKNKTYHRKKTVLLWVLCMGMMVGLAGRLVYLCVFRSVYYSEKADDLHERERGIKAARGRILDANGEVLAANRTVCTISVIHSQIEEPEAVIAMLVKELGISEETARKRVEKRSSIERVKTNVDKKTGDTCLLYTSVLHNEACDAHKELRKHKAKEVTFSDLTLDETRQLHTFDEYFKRETVETVFEKAGKKITPKLLLEAIRTLPEEKRKAVLLYYFEGMNDTEIAELFNTSRSTIQYRRTSSFELLRKYLEENADEWDEW